MIESKIINDINGTYLVIASDNSGFPEYEMKMFQYNEIKNFLPIAASRVNNKMEFHYKIMDCENLTKVFYSRTFGTEDIKNIFRAITHIVNMAGDFLLNTDSIMLNPEYIYVKNETYYFCYYPGCSISFHKGIRELMEYILERLNHDNQENVLLAYGLYQKILKNNYTIETLMEEFFKEDNSNRQEILPEKLPEKLSENLIRTDFENVEKTKKVLQLNADKEADIVSLEAELGLVSDTYNVREKKEKKKSGLKKLFDGKKRLFLSNDGVSKKQSKKLVIAEKSPYGTTQLLIGKSLVNQSGGRDILLINFPIEIGCGEDMLEGFINNQAVSRHHAIITYECGMYYVEDLGSTNGTFVNGSRLSPYEAVQIKEGDIVIFANERFCLN